MASRVMQFAHQFTVYAVDIENQRHFACSESCLDELLQAADKSETPEGRLDAHLRSIAYLPR